MTPRPEHPAAQGQDKQTLSEAWLSAVIKRLLEGEDGRLGRRIAAINEGLSADDRRAINEGICRARLTLPCVRS